MGVSVAFSDVFLKGGEGGIELAKTVIETVNKGTSGDLTSNNAIGVTDVAAE